MFFPVALSYTRTVFSRSTKTRHEVAGNAILMIDEETIEYFQIPVFETGLFLVEKEVKSYNFTLKNGKVVNVRRTQRTTSPVRSSGKIARIYQRSPIKYSRVKNHGIRFPYYFNVWMIKTAIASMVKNKRFPIYCRIDDRKHYFEILGDEPEQDSIWGKAEVIQKLGVTKNLDKAKWGNPTLVMPLISHPRFL